MSPKDQIEFFDLLINVSVLLNAWKKGDEGEIQGAINLLNDFILRRDDRLRDESGESRSA
jgi:hypothetical protein